jgi:hypothetical protein
LRGTGRAVGSPGLTSVDLPCTSPSPDDRLANDKAIYWYRNEPIVDYGHRTAAELVAEGHAEAVMAFIRDIEDGARG